MTKKAGMIFASFILILCISALTVAQQKKQNIVSGNEGMRHLEKTLAVNITMEPGNDTQGITVMTADGHFSFSQTQDKTEAHSEFSFQGDVELEGNNLVLVRYHLNLDTMVKSEQASQRIDLQGSVLVKMDSVVSIAKSKDHTFKVRLAAAE